MKRAFPGSIWERDTNHETG